MERIYKIGDTALFWATVAIIGIIILTPASKSTLDKNADEQRYYSKEFVQHVNNIIAYNPLVNGQVVKTSYEYFKNFDPLVPKIYNASGQITSATCKISIIRVALTVSPQTVDISATGFTTVYAVVPQGENNTTTVTAMPNCSLKTFTTTTAVINTTVSNSQVLSILGLNVIGLATPTTFTGMFVDLIVIGS